MRPDEIVTRTLDFRAPPRIPRQLWLTPWATRRHPEEVTRIQEAFPDDIANPEFSYRDPPQTRGDKYGAGIYVDEWGCIFESIQDGVSGEVRTPLVEDLRTADQVRMPRELLTVEVEQVNAFCRETDRFVLSPWMSATFERLQFMRKSENVFLDLAARPPELFALMDRMQSFYRDWFELWAGTEVDGLIFADDWGGQDNLLISPEQWRRTFKPRYKEFCDIAREHGKYVFMHSDGYIMEIIPDLIEIGVDALNCQVFLNGVEDLGERFAGRLTFWGELDRQTHLHSAVRREVAQAVHRITDCLYRAGGVVALCEFGPGVKPENVYTMYQRFQEFPAGGAGRGAGGKG